MLRTFEAVLQADGTLRFLEPVRLTVPQRVLVTFTRPLDQATDGALASQPGPAVDWLRDEEDAAWAHLQSCVVGDASGH